MSLGIRQCQSTSLILHGTNHLPLWHCWRSGYRQWTLPKRRVLPDSEQIQHPSNQDLVLQFPSQWSSRTQTLHYLGSTSKNVWRRNFKMANITTSSTICKPNHCTMSNRIQSLLSTPWCPPNLALQLGRSDLHDPSTKRTPN